MSKLRLRIVSNFHFGLLKDISSMLFNSDEYNVIIQIKENQNIKEFCAHSNLVPLILKT